jgi:alkaline phosphatase
MSTQKPLRPFFLGLMSAFVLVAALLALFARFGGIELALGNVVLRSQLGTEAALEAPAPGQPPMAPPLTIPDESAPRPKNVILFIGDGMGIGAVSAATALLDGPGGELKMMGTPHVGLMRTWAADDLVTDSAASGTAMATGHKTNRKMVGMLPDGKPVRNLFELARDNGYASGAVTTSGLVDATPASFTAHEAHRDNFDSILEQMLDSGTEVLIGGTWTKKDKVRRNARYNELLSDLEALGSSHGYTVLSDPEAMTDAPAPLLAVFPPRQDAKEAHGPPLEVSTLRAIELLASDPEGFILLVECEVTDSKGHDNDIAGTMAGVRELDRAVAVALDFIRGRNDTLILVTADHDTGGLALVDAEYADGRALVRWATGEHSTQWVPFFAFGPGAEYFSGVFDNTWVPQWLAELLDLGKLPQMAENVMD